MTHLFSKVMRLSYDLYQPIIMKKGGNIFYYKVYLQSLLRKFAVKTFNMPKSMSTIQNQISGCERSVKESLSQCAELVGDRNYTFSFSLRAFVKDITTLNLDDSLKHMRMVQDLFKECEKIVTIEKKRRHYASELHNMFAERQRKETVKRLTMQNSFKKRALPYEIPTPLNSPEAIDQD